jgi:DNA replication protein DnaC
MRKIEVDATRLPLLLHELRLPAIARLWPEFAERADKESWPAARLLSALAELEIAERGRRRIARNLIDAHLPLGKTLDNFDFSVVPMLSKARVSVLATGDTWLDKSTNLLLFGPPGAGKSHVATAIGRALVENGYRVLFTRTTDLVQRLQQARQALQLEAAIAKLDKYLESLGFTQHFLSSCELEALHFIGIRSFGEEFREDVVFRGIQEKFRKPLA